MESNQPVNDPTDLSPKAKKKHVRYIGIAVGIFFALVAFYMFSNKAPNAEELPVNTNPTIAETEAP